MSPCDPRAAGTYGQVLELPPLQRARVCKDCATLTPWLCIRAGLERTALVTFLEARELEVASLYLHSRMRNPPSPGISPSRSEGTERPLLCIAGAGKPNVSPRRKGNAKVTGSFRSNQERKNVKYMGCGPPSFGDPYRWTDGGRAPSLAHCTKVASGEITSVLCRILKSQNLKRKGNR